MTKKISYNPSSAGFLVGNQAVTKYESGCFRAILAKKNGAKTPFPPILAKMGAIHEDLCQVYLQQKYPSWTLEKDAWLTGPVLGAGSYNFRGRKDFTLTKEKEKIIVECKSMISKTGRREAIRKGNCSPGHIAQLLAYMIQEQVDKGLLMLGYYETNLDTGGLWCPYAFRDMDNSDKANFAVYDVTVNEEAEVYVGGKLFPYNVLQCLEHRNAALYALSSKQIAPRPFNSTDEYKSPCKYCVFSPVCDKYDGSALTGAPMSSKEFIDNCIVAATNHKQSGPVPFTPKRRPK